MIKQKNISIESRLLERLRPVGKPVMYQSWNELLFLHWSLEPSLVAQALPPGLEVDTFNGKAWIGIVPFQMRSVRPRFLPPMPNLSKFPEINLRTYVVDSQGRPGVWFYSLDTPKLLPNWIARTFFHLNYRLSRIRLEEELGRINYSSALRINDQWDRAQQYTWKRSGDIFLAEPGSLEFFLAERYRLFTYDCKHKQLLTGCVHHDPYPLQRVELTNYSTRLFETNNLQEPKHEPESTLASSGVAVEIFGISKF